MFLYKACDQSVALERPKENKTDGICLTTKVHEVENPSKEKQFLPHLEANDALKSFFLGAERLMCLNRGTLLIPLTSL